MTTQVSDAEAASDQVGPVEHRNEVRVIGRLSAPAVSRQLPSGDEIMVWRLIVDRTPTKSKRNFDLIECSAFKARLRRQAATWSAGDTIAVTGALRHRFWRGVVGLQSKSEVEVETAARVKGESVRRAKATAAKRPRKPG